MAVTAGAVALGGILGYVTHRPPPAPPDPSAALSVHVTGVIQPERGSPFFGIGLRALASSPVTPVAARTGYADLIMYVSPVPGPELRPGGTHRCTPTQSSAAARSPARGAVHPCCM